MQSQGATRGGRSQSRFEDYPDCPRPPLPPLQSPWDPAVAARLGLRDTPFVRAALRTGFLLSGFNAFHRRLADRDEEFLARPGNTPVPPSPRQSAVAALRDQPGMDPFLRGASLLAARWRLYADIRGGRFRGDTSRGQPLESRPYLNLMGLNVLFQNGAFREIKTACTSRFLVMARRRMYVVDLDVGEEGPSVGLLRSALEEVWDRSRMSEMPPAESALGMLTCAPKESQAAAFRILSQDPASAEALEMLKDSCVTICLELDRSPRTDAEAAMWALGGDFANRWFYSSLQIVVFGNGKACLVCNPQVGVPGNVIVQTGAELNRRGAELAAAGSGSGGGVSITEPRWNLEGVSFEPALTALAAMVDDQQSTFDLTGFGRMDLENAGLRPVEFFVVALQHAMHRLTGKLPNVRQIVSTAHYRCGMLALALVSTPEMAAFHEALRDPGVAPAVLRGLYAAAVESQRSACRTARSLVGIERQLNWFLSDLRGRRRRYAQAVLNAMWSVVGTPTRSKSDILLSHPSIAPEVPVIGRPGIRLPYVNCFGLNYQIFGDRIRLSIMPATAWNIPNEKFVAELDASLRELAERIGERSAEPAADSVYATASV